MLRARFSVGLMLLATLAAAPLAQAQQPQENQTRQPRRSVAQQPRPATPAPAAPAAQAPAAPTATRTEILTFDSWTVTCRDGRTPAEKRVCSAELQIQQTNNNVSTVIFSWVIGTNNEGKLVSVMRVPTGLLLTPGLDLKLEGKEPRKLPFTVCEPNRCEAAIVMDDAFIRDASATQNAEATIFSSDGRGLKFTIVNKGLSQALAAMRR